MRTHRAVGGLAAAVVAAVSIAGPVWGQGPAAPPPATLSRDQRQELSAQLTNPTQTDSSLCKTLLLDNPFASVEVNLRKLATRTDLAAGTSELAVTIVALEKSVANPSTFIDCSWIDENNDQRYQPDEPTSVAVLFSPDFVPNGPGSWKSTFTHRVAGVGRRAVCDRVVGLSLAPEDPSVSASVLASFSALADEANAPSALGAQALNIGLQSDGLKLYRSNRVCSPKVDTSVPEVPYTAMIGGAGLVAALALAARARRRGSPAPTA